MEMRHILAPTDFSEASNQAVMYAFGLAQACGAKLSLLHVVEPLASPLDGYIGSREAMISVESFGRDERHILPDQCSWIERGRDS